MRRMRATSSTVRTSGAASGSVFIVPPIGRSAGQDRGLASGWLVGCDEPLPKGSAPEHVRDVHEVGDTAGRAGIGRGELGEHSGEMRKRLRWGATGNGLHELLGGPVVVDPVRT